MSTRAAISDNVAALHQGVEVVGALEAEEFRNTTGASPRGGIGSHVRHCVEAYRCFLEGIGGGVVDYDERRREARLEEDPDYAVECLRGVIRDLEALDVAAQAQLRVKADAPGGGAEAWCASTVGRELRYLLSHTIHHYAILAMHLRRIGADPGPEFGVAPSTLAHWREQSECAPLPGSSSAVATSSTAIATNS